MINCVIVNGKDGFCILENGITLISGLQIHRYQAGHPIVTVHHVRSPSQFLYCFNDSFAEKDGSLVIILVKFILKKVSKAGAKFDIDKAKWFNEQYLRDKPLESVTNEFMGILAGQGVECSLKKATLITELLIERVTFTHEIWEKGQYFFMAPELYDQKVVNKRWNRDTVEVLSKLSGLLSEIEPFEVENIRKAIMEFLEAQGANIGSTFAVLRLSLTGVGGGPDLMAIIEILGREQTLERIKLAKTQLAEYLKD